MADFKDTCLYGTPAVWKPHTKRLEAFDGNFQYKASFIIFE